MHEAVVEGKKALIWININISASITACISLKSFNDAVFTVIFVPGMV